MPTPIAHSLVGGIFYFIWKRRLPNSLRPVFLGILFCVTYSNLLDFDFIPGIILGNLNRFHHGISHSIGFAVVIAFVTGLVSRFLLKRSFWRIGGVSLILLLVHLFMDFSTGDTSVPYGIMLFWPFSNRYYISPISIFPAFPKRASVADVVNPLNLKAYIYELILLGPLFIIISFIRLRGVFKEK